MATGPTKARQAGWPRLHLCSPDECAASLQRPPDACYSQRQHPYSTHRACSRLPNIHPIATTSTHLHGHQPQPQRFLLRRPQRPRVLCPPLQRRSRLCQLARQAGHLLLGRRRRAGAGAARRLGAFQRFFAGRQGLLRGGQLALSLLCLCLHVLARCLRPLQARLELLSLCRKRRQPPLPPLALCLQARQPLLERRRQSLHPLVCRAALLLLSSWRRRAVLLLLAKRRLLLCRAAGRRLLRRLGRVLALAAVVLAYLLLPCSLWRCCCSIRWCRPCGLCTLACKQPQLAQQTQRRLALPVLPVTILLFIIAAKQGVKSQK